MTQPEPTWSVPWIEVEHGDVQRTDPAVPKLSDGRYVRAADIEALLPNVYDGMHLVDCPYVAVLERIREALGAEARGV